MARAPSPSLTPHARRVKHPGQGVFPVIPSSPSPNTPEANLAQVIDEDEDEEEVQEEGAEDQVDEGDEGRSPFIDSLDIQVIDSGGIPTPRSPPEQRQTPDAPQQGGAFQSLLHSIIAHVSSTKAPAGRTASPEIPSSPSIKDAFDTQVPLVARSPSEEDRDSATPETSQTGTGKRKRTPSPEASKPRSTPPVKVTSSQAQRASSNATSRATVGAGESGRQKKALARPAHIYENMTAPRVTRGSARRNDEDHEEHLVKKQKTGGKRAPRKSVQSTEPEDGEPAGHHNLRRRRPVKDNSATEGTKVPVIPRTRSSKSMKTKSRQPSSSSKQKGTRTRKKAVEHIPPQQSTSRVPRRGSTINKSMSPQSNGREQEAPEEADVEAAEVEETLNNVEDDPYVEGQDDGVDGEESETENVDDYYRIELVGTLGSLYGQRRNLKKALEALNEIGVQRVGERNIRHRIVLGTKTIEELVSSALDAEKTYQRLAEQDPSAVSETALAESLLSVQEKLDDIENVISSFDEYAGDKKTEMIQDIFAHAIPGMVHLLLAAIGYHGKMDHIDTTSLSEITKITDLICSLYERANHTRELWQVKLDSALHLINPSRQHVYPSIRSIRDVLNKELEKRSKDSRRKEEEQALQLSYEAAEEEAARKRAEELRLKDERHLTLNKQLAQIRAKDEARELSRLLQRKHFYPYNSSPPIMDLVMPTQNNSRTGRRGYSGKARHNHRNGISVSAADMSRDDWSPGEEKWSDEELTALMDGLQLFTGSNRYDQILQTYGRVGRPLQYKNFDDLFRKAKEMRTEFETYAESHPEEGPAPWWTLTI
ncbi:MAG: hypothetical protein M1819_001819 [Sarea resinae]|nr:MAG: hypothetical protein M1819_001819 [Sarea resinae]